MSEPRRKLSIQVPELPWLKEKTCPRELQAIRNISDQKPPDIRVWEEARLVAMKRAAEKKQRWAGTD